MSLRALVMAAAALSAASLLGGCAYDYLQHSDRVAYSAGDAVQANLEAETTDPAAYDDTKGLGKNGNVTPSTEVVTP